MASPLYGKLAGDVAIPSRKEAVMLVGDRKGIDRSATTVADRSSERAAKAGRGERRWSGQGHRGFLRPAIDQDSQTIVLLFIVAALAALNFMLRFPELGAVIAPLNQF